MTAQAFLTTDSIDNLTAGSNLTFTPTAMSGTINGAAWKIQKGMLLTLEPNTGNIEVVEVSAVTSTTFTVVSTTKTHNGTTTPFQIMGHVFNQRHDAAGELDGGSGRGAGASVQYAFNGGATSGTSNIDRIRDAQGHGGVTATTLNGSVSSGGTSLVLASVAGLYPGMQIAIYGSGVNEAVYVAKNYTVGSTTIPLTTGLLYAHTNGAYAVYSVHNVQGPLGNPFLPDGLPVALGAMVDMSSQWYYATQGVPGLPGILATGSYSKTFTLLSATSPSGPAITPGTPVTGLGGFRSMTIYANIQGATGGTLDIYLQFSPDGGTTWVDWGHFPQLTAGASGIQRVGTFSRVSPQNTLTPLVTVGSATSPALAANNFVGGDWGDRLRTLLIAGTGTTAGTTQTILAVATT
jgi:hypothetical protein